MPIIPEFKKKCLTKIPSMDYLSEPHNDSMELDIIITSSLLFFPFYRGKSKDPENKFICPGSHE